MLSRFLQAQDKAATRAQLNGVGGIFTAIGKAGTLTPSFNKVTGNLNFSFSTDEGGNLVIGFITPDAVMQFSIVAVGATPRILSSARVELLNDGSEKQSLYATDAQLQELSDRFDAAAGIVETLDITVDASGAVAYAFTAAAGNKVSAVITR